MSNGIKDRNLDGDGIRPSERNVRFAANLYGIHSDHDIQALIEQIQPITVGTNLNTHMRELKESAERLEAMSRDHTQCNPAQGPQIRLMTLDDVRAPKPGEDLNPPANSTAPGGQRY